MEYFHTLTLKIPLIIKANAKYHINISSIIISSYQHQAWDPEGWDCKSYDHIAKYGYYECFVGNRLQEVALLSQHKYQLAFLRRSAFQRQMYAVSCRMLVSSEAQMSHLDIRVARKILLLNMLNNTTNLCQHCYVLILGFSGKSSVINFYICGEEIDQKKVAGQFQKYHMK